MMNLNEKELTILRNALILEKNRIDRLIRHKEQLIFSVTHARVAIGGELAYAQSVSDLMEKLR